MYFRETEYADVNQMQLAYGRIQCWIFVNVVASVWGL
jgi:hypothetical protein